MKKNISVIISVESGKEAADVIDLMDSLTTEEQRGMLAFIQGMKFAAAAKSA